MSVNSPADVDDEALVVHAGIHPALRGPTVVVVSTQADHAVRATFTVGALNERLNQRAPLLAQARKILLGQRGIDDAARRPGALGNVAVVGLVVALVNAALAVVIGVIDRRHMLAVELCRRADELSVLGHREEQRRDAVVYLDRNKRITVDVGLRPDRLPPETLRPRIYAAPSNEGLTSSQIELLLAALNLSRALAERWAPALITEAMQCFDATLRAVNPPPADAGLDAHALRLTLDHIVYARQVYQRDVAHRGAAAPAHD